MNHQHVTPVRTNLIIFGVLMALLVLTIVLSYVNLGPLHFAAAMVIATVKAVLIVLYFMHVRFSPRLVWVFASAAFLWLGILLALTLSDYFSRSWLENSSI
jgi:cytochrome c oxidase subunit 4